MKTETLAHLSQSLIDLADAYGVRQPSEGALRIFKQALQGIDDKAIFTACNIWADHNNKYPTPKQLRELALREASASIERRLASEKAERERWTPQTPSTANVSPAMRRAIDQSLKYSAFVAKHSDPMQWKWNAITEIENGTSPHPFKRIFLEKHVLGRPLNEADFERARQHKDPYPLKTVMDFLSEEERQIEFPQVANNHNTMEENDEFVF